MKKGMVTLIGAGPGHPDHLTLKGLRSLQTAEAIVYDALIDQSFRFLFPKQAKVFFVGKRCGRHYCSQEDINRLLIEQASLGKRVARLKGGDPFLFGRGGEEWLALAVAGIPVEVVPGVSSLQSVGGLAGIPVTHRGVSSAVMVLDGHRPDALNWPHITAFEGTLAFFMATKNIQEIAVKMLDHGAPGIKPVALIENGSLPDQTIQISTLAEAAVQGLCRVTAGPGLLYIGDVVHLQPLLTGNSLKVNHIVQV